VAVYPLLASLQEALVEQVVEMAAYGGGGQVQASRDVGRGGGTLLQDRLRHALTRRRVVVDRPRGSRSSRVFHNANVVLLVSSIQRRVA
jgi:hypothetical protein